MTKKIKKSKDILGDGGKIMQSAYRWCEACACEHCFSGDTVSVKKRRKGKKHGKRHR